MRRIAIVTVVAAHGVPLGDDDAAVPGRYAVAMGDGAHPPVPRAKPEAGDDPLVEAAKDVFHDRVGIDDLEAFEIGFKILPEGSGDPADEDLHWL